MMSPSPQVGEPNYYQQFKHCVHQSFFELPDLYPVSGMSFSDLSTPPLSQEHLYNVQASPDSIFADPGLLDWDDTVNGCHQAMFPPAAEIFPDTTPVTVGQYFNATSDTTQAYGNSPPQTGDPLSTLSSSGSSSPGSTCSKETTRRVAKRKMNTMAARRYRQKRIDRMNELEADLEMAKREREEWRVKASLLEGEVSALRTLLESRKEM